MGKVCSEGKVMSGGGSLSQAWGGGMGPGRELLVCVWVRWEAREEKVGLGFDSERGGWWLLCGVLSCVKNSTAI